MATLMDDQNPGPSASDWRWPAMPTNRWTNPTALPRQTLCLASEFRAEEGTKPKHSTRNVARTKRGPRSPTFHLETRKPNSDMRFSWALTGSNRRPLPCKGSALARYQDR